MQQEEQLELPLIQETMTPKKVKNLEEEYRQLEVEKRLLEEIISALIEDQHQYSVSLLD